MTIYGQAGSKNLRSYQRLICGLKIEVTEIYGSLPDTLKQGNNLIPALLYYDNF